MKLKPMGLQFGLDAKVNTDYSNHGLVNSILHQTFGNSVSVSCMVLAFFVILMIVGALVAYSLYRSVWKNTSAIRQIQAYLRTRKNPEICSSV